MASLNKIELNIDQIRLRKFKRVEDIKVEMDSLNVLVGGNNSGKSSVLQGIHFSVIASIASRQLGRDTFTQSNLLYCPARDFTNLRNGLPYSNQSNFSFLDIWGRVFLGGRSIENHFQVKIYRGRNEGNVGCQRNRYNFLGRVISDDEHLFSIYVPGLAGIPQDEQLRSESVIRRGVAGGDANMYLRNVLLLIKQKNKIKRLNYLMKKVFPDFYIDIKYDGSKDIFIDINISLTGSRGRKCPLELVGTGVLQSLQIFSYVTLFEPSLLLLDEPDAHLHPDNQSLLATVLLTISTETYTQIIASTHSRHIVEALYDEANFVWLKDGKVFDQGIGIDRLSFLLDLGALDSFDKLKNGNLEWVILTEDSGFKPIKYLLEVSGFDDDSLEIYSYKSSSNIQSALILAEFIAEIAPGTKIIIHRDSDFMTDDEKSVIQTKIEEIGAIPFLTGGSDIESYFLTPDHLAELLDEELTEIENWLSEIAQKKHNDLSHSFVRKRDDINRTINKNKSKTPSTKKLLGEEIPLDPDLRLGKSMLKFVRSHMNRKFGKNVDPISKSEVLFCEELVDILDENP